MSSNSFGSQKIYLSTTFTTNTTLPNYQGCTYYLDNYVYINSGATLTIANGSNLVMQNNYLEVGYNSSAILQANGVTFNNGTIYFYNSSTGTINNSNLNSINIYCNSNSSLNINQSNIDFLCNIVNNSTNTLNAINNYWGDASGPFHATLNPNGQGSKLSGNINFIPYLTIPVGNTILGIDVYEGTGDVNWSQVQNAGNKGFAFVKATSGVLGIDSMFSQNMKNIKTYAPEMIVGAYHFAYPNYTNANTGIAEADHFLSIAGNYIGPGYLPPVLDLENDKVIPGGSYPLTLGVPQLIQWINAWAGEIVLKKGVKPIIYTFSSFAQNLNIDLSAQTLNNYYLWIATYYNPDPATIIEKIEPWSTWTFQQYATDPITQNTSADKGGKCPGIVGYADLDSYNGNLESFKTFISQITRVDRSSLNIPNAFLLYQNYPNPFNPTTTINFSIPKSSYVTLKVYDVLGREVTTLVNENKPSGNYSIKFDGSKLTSGVYFYRMESGSFSQTKKLLLLK
jgi:GH25 family lysozyme M1 (1,4-beta-N-acetylmuramidase)